MNASRSPRTWWPYCKALLGVAILAAIGFRVARDLNSDAVAQLRVRPSWLVAAGLCYLGGLAFSAVYWWHLVRRLGQELPLRAALRAYYVGHLGKYLPGKAWALLLRTTLAHSSGVPLGLGAVSTLYEVLTTMAAGVCVAALVFGVQAWSVGFFLDGHVLRDFFLLQAPQHGDQDATSLLVLALVLLVPTGGPLLPPIFNRFVERLGTMRRLLARYQAVEPGSARPVAIPWAALGEGLILAAIGWLLLGASLWATLEALAPVPPLLSWSLLFELAAIVAVAYVAGFVIVFVPGGLGVREYFLSWFLLPVFLEGGTMEEADARGLAVVTVVLFRLVWTAAEVICAGILYGLPGGVVSPHPTEL